MMPCIADTVDMYAIQHHSAFCCFSFKEKADQIMYMPREKKYISASEFTNILSRKYLCYVWLCSLCLRQSLSKAQVLRNRLWSVPSFSNSNIPSPLLSWQNDVISRGPLASANASHRRSEPAHHARRSFHGWIPP